MPASLGLKQDNSYRTLDFCRCLQQFLGVTCTQMNDDWNDHKNTKLQLQLQIAKMWILLFSHCTSLYLVSDAYRKNWVMSPIRADRLATYATSHAIQYLDLHANYA